MRFLELVSQHAAAHPQALAQITSAGDELTYGELWKASEAIAAHLDAQGAAAATRAPVMVFGHKNPLMLACFLGCMKAGRPYVPVDCHSVPAERVASIAAQLDSPVVLATEDFPKLGGVPVAELVDASELARIVTAGGASSPERWISGEDLCYILFTSGSTGAPKGVQVTAACFDNFCSWDLTLGGGAAARPGVVYLDQAPFSFDLSVFELAGALASGGTLFSLVHETQQSVAAEFAALAESGVTVWVSTPSFADLCLSSPEFSAQLLPKLELFIFCGETLANITARHLLERFPAATVLNTYGPTESTVAVTQVEVTSELAAAEEPLPVGAPRPGTRLRIVDRAGRECAPGEPGEVIIEGDTVALGYYGRPDLTARAFGVEEVPDPAAGSCGFVRTYRTGDEGYLDEQGLLHYRGRLDLQVKLNGFRIELGEIEEQLRRLPGVDAAAAVAAERDGKVSHLVAHVVYSGPRAADTSDFRLGLLLKDELRPVLPHYMIPKKIVFRDALPRTGNGKIDRRALKAAGR